MRASRSSASATTCDSMPAYFKRTCMSFARKPPANTVSLAGSSASSSKSISHSHDTSRPSPSLSFTKKATTLVTRVLRHDLEVLIEAGGVLREVQQHAPTGDVKRLQAPVLRVEGVDGLLQRGKRQPARPAAAAVASKLYTMYAPVYGAAIEPAAGPLAVPDARRTTTRSGPASRPLPRSPGRNARTRRWDTRTIPVARTGDSRIPTWTSSAGTSARRPPNSTAAPGPRPRRTRWRGSPRARRCGRTAGRRRCTPAPCPATSPARPRCCPGCGRSRPRGPAGRGTG